MVESLVPGDWLVHVNFKVSGSWRYGPHKRRAEVIDVIGTTVGVYIEGEPGRQALAAADVTRWWDRFTPPPGEDPPAWIKAGAVFHARDEKLANRAVIRTVRVGWISYIESCSDYHDVFRLLPYDEFHAHWSPSRTPSAWERLRTPAV